jgi:hypothetical protein
MTGYTVPARGCGARPVRGPSGSLRTRTIAKSSVFRTLEAVDDTEKLWRNDVLFHWDRNDPSWMGTELLERLFLGGTPQNDIVVQPGTVSSPWQPSAHQGLYDACVTMTPISGPAGGGVLELRVPLNDRDNEVLDMIVLRHAVEWIVARYRAGSRVLVRCHAGLNRSGLVVVPAMTWIDRSLSFDDALAIARTKRHELVLCRPEFETAARELSRPDA